MCIRLTLLIFVTVLINMFQNLYKFMYYSLPYSNNTCAPTWDCVCTSFDMTSEGIFPIGYYCPQGSTYPTACDSGKYCETPGLAVPTGIYLYATFIGLYKED